jgi:hypothetical protein
MVGAIDAVCDVAQRIICKLKEGAGGPSLPGTSVGNSARAYPPTPANEALCRQPRPAKGHQASAWLQDVNIDLPGNSLWQQGSRSETWRSLWLGRMVCPAWG